MKNSAALLFILLFLSFSPDNYSIAQSSEQLSDSVETTLQLPELTIKGDSGSGYSTSRGYSVYKKKISLTEAYLTSISGLNSLLNQVPGVQFSDRGTMAVGEQITMRGAGWRSQFGVRGLHILEDGHSITSPDGQTNTEGFNAFFVQALEVYRGPAALMWGNGGGGVLHITTFDPAEPEGIKIRTLFGDHQTRRFDASIVQSINAGKRKVLFSTMSTDGYRRYSAGQTLQLATQKIQLYPKNWVRRHKIKYAALLNSENPGTLDLNSFNHDPFQSRAFFENSMAGKTTHDLFLAENLLHSGDKYDITILSNIGLRSVDNPLPFAYIDVNRRSGSAQAIIRRKNSSKLDWSYGLEGAFQADNRKETENLFGASGDRIYLHQQENLSTISTFGKIYNKSAQLSYEAGIRFDHTWIQVKNLLDSSAGEASDNKTLSSLSKDSFTSIIPSLSVAYQLKTINLYANLQTAFENPTLSELSNLPEGGTGINPLLRAEKTFAFESGIRSNGENSSFDLTLFHHRVHDLLLPYQMNADGEFFFSNEGMAIIQGVEFWTSFQRYIYKDTRFNQEIAMSLTNAIFQNGQYEGNQLPGVSPLQINCRSEISLNDSVLEFSLHYREKTQINSLNSESRPAYLKMDLKFAITISDKVIPNLQWINITDERYSESISVNAVGDRAYAPALPSSLFMGFIILL